MTRRTSISLRLGRVWIGGDAPIVVQSMTKTDTRDISATIDQIMQLQDCGCEVVRLAVPDREAAQSLANIRRSVSLPLVADIHFDYRLALAALESGIDGLRLNPGNIGDTEQIAMVVTAARHREVPIRIGVNAGSIPPGFQPEAPPVERMVNMALEQIRLMEALDFSLIKVSLKAFDVPSTVQAYQMIAGKMPYPLHLGITEAGLPRTGAIRSAIGIGILLYQGIGDTVRVSLSAHPCEEVFVAYEILKSLGLRQRGPTLVSCPSCGRAEVDIIALAEAVSKRMDKIRTPIKVAVMGCVVNGPGEARDADVGIACGRGKGAIFRKGEVVGTANEQDLIEALMTEISHLDTGGLKKGHEQCASLSYSARHCGRLPLRRRA